MTSRMVVGSPTRLELAAVLGRLQETQRRLSLEI